MTTWKVREIAIEGVFIKDLLVRTNRIQIFFER